MTMNNSVSNLKLVTEGMELPTIRVGAEMLCYNATIDGKGLC